MATAADPLLGQESAPGQALQHGTKRASKCIAELMKNIARRSRDPSHKTYLAISVVAGLICGAVAYVYSFAFSFSLDMVWRTLPQRFVLPAIRQLQKRFGFPAPDGVAWVYTVLASTLMGTAAGVVQSLLGSPGDLPETIEAIHEKVHSCPTVRPAQLIYA